MLKNFSTATIFKIIKMGEKTIEHVGDILAVLLILALIVMVSMSC